MSKDNVISTDSIKKAETPADGTLVKLNEKIDLIGTGLSEHMPKGKKYPGVQKLHAERLISKGVAKRAK